MGQNEPSVLGCKNKVIQEVCKTLFVYNMVND
jgi:hypothetical protein